MILKNIRYLVTQNQERQILENIDLRIEEDRITAIGKNLHPRAEKTVNCSDKIVMPGLVNAHTHSPMTLLRGISDNKNLQDWLHQDIFPAEQKLEETDIYTGTLLAGIEMLKTGTTTFNDMYDEMEAITAAVENTGIRAVLSKGIIDKQEPKREEIDKAVEFVDKYQNHPLIKPGFAPHAVYTVREQTLRELNDYAKIFDTVYHIHVSETKKENTDCEKENGKTPIQYLESLNTLNPRFIAAHGVWLNEKDIEILRKSGSTVVHNPNANLKLGSGIAPVTKLLEEGVNVALGTDGVASNNNLNMFEEMKIAVNLQKKDSPETVTEQEVLDMATINGAKALGLSQDIGSIEIGKKADLLIIDKDKAELTPIHGKRGLISNLVYAFNGNVEHVIVNGELRVKNGELTDIDEGFVFSKARKIAEKF